MLYLATCLLSENTDVLKRDRNKRQKGQFGVKIEVKRDSKIC